MKSTWASCRACDLCRTRNHVTMARGRFPATVVFLGDSPRGQDDVMGFPFVGEDGDLMDRLVADAATWTNLSAPPPVAFVHLVGCFPKDHRGQHRKPTSKELKACKERVAAILRMSGAKAIVIVGEVPKSHIPKTDLPTVKMKHPAKLRSALPKDARLEYKKAVAAIGRAINLTKEA